MNLYNKIYGSVQETLPHFKNPEEALAFYLEGASKYLAKAESAIEEERFEDRCNHSDGALMIFAGILSHLEQSPPSEKKEVQGLIDYCKIMNELIIRMNIKNDIAIAQNLTKEVRKMAQHWRSIGEKMLNQKNTEQSLKKPAPAPQPTDSLELLPSLSSSALEPPLKTADFSA